MFLGIDLGTSEVKLLLLADDHTIVATAGEKIAVSRPQPHWSEQDPNEWWSATGKAVAALRAKAPDEFAKVRAIGLSGQMHGATLLDAKDQVLRPAILWNDTRSAAECAELTARCPELPQISGNLAMPGFTAPKLVWVAKHEPEIFKKIAAVLLPKDFLRMKLVGDKVSEMSDAAGTLWLDVAKRDWSDELLAATGLTRAQMPRLVEGSEVSGKLLPEVASAWGLSEDVVVAGGGGDNAASAIGIGAVAPGDGFISLGTSGVLFVVTDRFRPNPASAVHAFCHAVPNRWHQMSVMLSAASCLSWVTRLVHAENEGALLAEANALSVDERMAAPIFLPYLSGERTPHNDAQAQGVFFGLNHDTSAAHLAYSVIEGVAFGTMDGLAALQSAGTVVGRLALVGGGSRSAEWAQLLASILNTEVVTLEGSETGGALGAARLGWLAAGGSVETVCRAPVVRDRFLPNAAQRERLLPRYQRFTSLYPRLRELFVR
ncbi:xylulokinase [Niveibacterium terrae]|uniref:xylulokinase n=1 Tax=Niveibacterium terrae TaxID=3373598 RepID=UPI003A931248